MSKKSNRVRRVFAHEFKPDAAVARLPELRFVYMSDLFVKAVLFRLANAVPIQGDYCQ